MIATLRKLLWKSRFRREHASYFKRPRIAYGTVSCDLVTDGVTLIRRAYSIGSMEQRHTDALRIINAVRYRHDTTDAVIYGDDGIYRKYIKQENQFPTQQWITDIALNHMRHCKCVTKYLDYKPDITHDYTTIPHFDSWKSQIKIFTLLSDVTEENAPFVYWKGTHLNQPWRYRFDEAIASGDDVGSAGLVPPHILRDLGFKPTVFTGKAGDVIIADTRGVHRASNLRSGYRLQIVEKFIAK